MNNVIEIPAKDIQVGDTVNPGSKWEDRVASIEQRVAKTGHLRTEMVLCRDTRGVLVARFRADQMVTIAR